MVRHPADEFLEEDADSQRLYLDAVKRVTGLTLPTDLGSELVCSVRVDAHPLVGEVAEIVFKHAVILPDQASENGTYVRMPR